MVYYIPPQGILQTVLEIKMTHPRHNQKLLNRIKRLQGQLNAIEQAVSGGQVPCIEVLQQVAAVKGALAGLMNELVAEHLTECVLTTDYDKAQLQIFLDILKKYA